MIYSLLLGLLLAIDPAPTSVAIGVLAAMTVLKGLWGIAFRKAWVTGEPSHYAQYLERLKQAGPLPRLPWFQYLVQVVVIWVGAGLVVYAFGRWVWLPRAWWTWCITVYIGIGFVLAFRHLAAGKRGAAGPIVTLFAMAILWPAVVYTESRR